MSAYVFSPPLPRVNLLVGPLASSALSPKLRGSIRFYTTETSPRILGGSLTPYARSAAGVFSETSRVYVGLYAMFPERVWRFIRALFEVSFEAATKDDRVKVLAVAYHSRDIGVPLNSPRRKRALLTERF